MPPEFMLPQRPPAPGEALPAPDRPDIVLSMGMGFPETAREG